jgi:hypothetical protein
MLGSDICASSREGGLTTIAHGGRVGVLLLER